VGPLLVPTRTNDVGVIFRLPTVAAWPILRVAVTVDGVVALLLVVAAFSVVDWAVVDEEEEPHPETARTQTMIESAAADPAAGHVCTRGS
jgi:hypothetical protein